MWVCPKRGGWDPNLKQGEHHFLPTWLVYKPSFVEFCWSGPNQPRNLNYSMLCNIDMPMDIPYYWFQINYMLIFKSHACADHSSHEPSRSRSKGCLPDFSPWCFLGYPKTTTGSGRIQGLVNVPIEHHPTIGDIITNKYLKVMFKIPKTGHLPTPDNGNPWMG